MTFKKITAQIHLWLGLISGLLVLFLGITGCILAYEHEIENLTQSYRFTEKQNKPLLRPSQLKWIAEKQLPDKKSHSVNYTDGNSAVVTFYNGAPEYFYLVFINPYNGQVLKVKDMSEDFFRIVLMGHYYLWLPPQIGQPIVASGTLIFVILLITGLIMWWPKSKAAQKQSFTIRWNAKWRRVNYDLHNVLGFYVIWIVLIVALTGMIMGFQWFAKSVYWTASGGQKMVEYYEAKSDSTLAVHQELLPAFDRLWIKAQPTWRASKGSLEVHFPENKNAALELAVNSDPDTYWKTNYLYYDQYTLNEIEVKHAYGRIANAGFADKLMRMNYDIHIGAIAGLTGKTIAFFASLTAASMPVTGFVIWWLKKKKKYKQSKKNKFRRKKNSVTFISEEIST